MKSSVRGLGSCRFASSIVGLVLLLVCMPGGSSVLAHSPVVDAVLSDWCVGAFSNTIPGGGRPTEDRTVKFEGAGPPRTGRSSSCAAIAP